MSMVNSAPLNPSENGLLDLILQNLSLGIAIVDVETWEVRLENPKFSRWFPANGAPEPLTKRLTGLVPERALPRLQEGRPFSFETESHGTGRPVPIAVEIRRIGEQTSSSFVVECRDVSKQKQTQYMLDSYSQLAERNARQLQREKMRVEKLLLNIMPKSVYEELTSYGTVTPQRFNHASVLMLDFVGFTQMALSREPGTVVMELNDIFTGFDSIVEQFGCERIKTIGDAYMAVSGLPEPTPEHAHNIARAALRMKRYIERRNQAHPEQWQCRIGISSGVVIGSILGVHKYIYDVFGPAVNMSARMESLSEPMRITVCEDTYQLLRDDFVCSQRGEFDVKGCGTKTLYFLDRELPSGR